MCIGARGHSWRKRPELLCETMLRMDTVLFRSYILRTLLEAVPSLEVV
jgi:hypothetical protein